MTQSKSEETWQSNRNENLDWDTFGIPQAPRGIHPALIGATALIREKMGTVTRGKVINPRIDKNAFNLEHAY